jgi:hypothetical protein
MKSRKKYFKTCADSGKRAKSLPSLNELEYATKKEDIKQSGIQGQCYFPAARGLRGGVVLSPGMNVTAEHYEYHSRLLAAQGNITLALDAPQHKAEGVLSLERLVENIGCAHKLVQERTGGLQVVYEGHSLGATAALARAMGYDYNFRRLTGAIDDYLACADQGEQEGCRLKEGIVDQILFPALHCRAPQQLVLIAPPPDYQKLVPLQGIAKPLLKKIPVALTKLIAGLCVNYFNRSDMLVSFGKSHERQRLIPYPDSKGELHIMYLTIPDKNEFFDMITSVPNLFSIKERIDRMAAHSDSDIVRSYQMKVNSIPKHVAVGGMDSILQFPLLRPWYRRRLLRTFKGLGNTDVAYFPFMSHMFATNEHSNINLRIQHMEHPMLNAYLLQSLQSLEVERDRRQQAGA